MINLAEPVFLGNEVAYVTDALQRRQLSMAEYVARFETAFAPLAGCTYAVAVSSGTAALHLILAALGIGPDDEVIVPAITFVATANAVRYCGARVVIADVDPTTWCISPVDVAHLITARTRAVVAVHLYGQPADMRTLYRYCAARDIYLIEDAAEAPGARIAGFPVGSWSCAAAFSFYGNKIISTGEGGMVTTNSEKLVGCLRLLRGQGMDPQRRYWHTEVGFNYRMTELQGALGLAQTERFAEHLAARRRVAKLYRQFGPGLRWQAVAPDSEPAYWLNVALFTNRDAMVQRCAAAGIETRPMFYPLYRLPPYVNDGAPGNFPAAESIAAQGLCLPSHANLTAEDVARIVEVVQSGPTE